MSRINTNVTSLISQRVLGQNKNQLNVSLERLSTGLKINSGADNPAGLIASENLRSEKAGISQAINNAERASNIVGTAEGGLSEISSLLTQMQSLVGEAANSGGLSKEEINANQLQVDSILSTINRIAGTTSFQGKKLLNGELDYATSGVTATQVNDLRINAAKLGSAESVAVDVAVVASSEAATINYTGGTLASGAVQIEIAGNLGTEQLSLASGATASSIITAVNAVKDITGVSATAAAGSGGGVVFSSTEFGASQFVSVKALSGTFTTDVTKDEGTDAQVTVNGNQATTDGLNVSYRSGNLDVEFKLDETFNAPGTSSFNIVGGGADFSMGSKVSNSDMASIGISAVTTGSLGTKSGGYLDSLKNGGENALTGDNLVGAQKIVDTAVKQVAQLRGRLGAFQKFTIGSTINNLGVALENVSASESAIRDTDFAEETANLTRSQILSQAAQTVLAQANAAPQSALSLLQ
jgi:flagellin